ncbi:unnamed protein product [Ostreobium quekettii]|uniref:Protein kinase domain-containing protein n=1 Tax=Ostreobium quekettii TaxID=121088 RepID=A0A8S1IUY5_9CHLO|nr:unnamed protein product [Ostreobium quekettii]
MEGSQAEAAERRGPQYNHRMVCFLALQLDRVKELERPPSASAEEWEAFELSVHKGWRLVAKHTSPFDIRTFYKIEDMHSTVEEICKYLKAQAREWRVDCGAALEGCVPQDFVQEDREYLHKLLAYILKGVESGIDDKLLMEWLPIKRRHEVEMRELQIIGEDVLVLKRQMGQGGYGFVYEAEWNLATVAVKRPLRDGDLPIEEFASLVREVMVQGRLRHPNIALVYATTPSGWLVMEAADSDLGTLCHGKERLSWHGTLNILRQAAKGLCYLHNLSPAIVHSDVKASNFLVFGKEPSSCRIKVADFGLAFEALEGRSKTARLGGGTLEWMAPEIYEQKPITISSDIFSFGVTMYEVLTGAYPYGSDKLNQYAQAAVVMNKKLSGKEPCTIGPDDCPNDMHALMMRCCSIDPEDRPTMLEVIKCLEELPNDWKPASQLSPKASQQQPIFEGKLSAFHLAEYHK